MVSRLKYLELYIHKETEIYRQLACYQLSGVFVHFGLFVATNKLPLDIHPHPNLPPLIVTPTETSEQLPSKFSLPEVLKIPQ